MFSATSILPRQQGAGNKLWTIDEVGISIRSLVLRRLRTTILATSLSHCSGHNYTLQISTKATQLRSLGGCLPSLRPSSNLVEADHMQVQRATKHSAYCNRPRSIQHGAVHGATMQLQWAVPHTYWAPITAIGCAAEKSRTFTIQNKFKSRS